MVVTQTTEKTLTETPHAENRILLRHVTWQAYEAILSIRGERRSPRLSYYKGLLEFMAPLEAHENSSDLIGNFINIVVEEAGLNIKSMGSTTLNRPDLRVGAEPDKCYYIANETLVRGKTVDLSVDPPPDLVIEVDITNTNLNKNFLCADLGVPELWRFNGQTLTIYQLQDGRYQEVTISPAFPKIPKDALYQFLSDCRQQGETSAKRSFRDSLRGKENQT